MIRTVALGLFALVANDTAAACRDGAIELRGDWGSARFTVEVADDPQERAQGLMFRESMPRSAGMLFVYPTPQTTSFWMKNTLIPLDMVFADATGTVRHVHANAVPGDLTPIPGGDDIQFVLEINGGMAAAMGIGVGSQMRHTAISDEIAAWSCSE